MDLDWKSIAGAVAPIAPKLGAVLGTAIGGPFGSIIGGLAGNAIAAAFDVEPTPEAVGTAIATDPNAADKLAQLEAQRGQEIIAQAQAEIARYEQAGLTARTNVTEIATTQRAEIAAGVSWFHWRHLTGFVTLAFGVVVVVAMAKAIFSGTPVAADLAAIINAVTPIFLALCAFNGYVAMDTTNLRQTAITGERGSSVLSTVKAAIASKK